MQTAEAEVTSDSPPKPSIFPTPLFIKRFRDITIRDIPTVGGKTASLGEMLRELAPQGVKVPDGFAITAEAYRHFLRRRGLDKRIDRLLEGLDTRDIDALRRCGSAIREAILATALPTDLETEILGAYDELRVSSKTDDVAVRSSATAEDLPDASFAGAQQTFLNVEGNSALFGSVSPLFRLVVYRSCDFLPRRQRIRSSQSRAFHRRATNGAL